MSEPGTPIHEVHAGGPQSPDLRRIITGSLRDGRIGVLIDPADDLVWCAVAASPAGEHVVDHRDETRRDRIAAKFPKTATAANGAHIGLVVSARSGRATLDAMDALELTGNPPLLFRPTDAAGDASALAARGYALCTLRAFGRGRRPLDHAAFSHACATHDLMGAFVPRPLERPRVFAARALAFARNPWPMTRALLARLLHRLPR